MKKVISAVVSSLLLANIAHAGPTALAVTKKANEEVITLPVSLNNQSGLDITTDSDFVPADAKDVAPQGNAIFDINIPAKVGIQVIRYTAGSHGCDFYIDTQSGPMSGTYNSFITAVPVDSQTMCNVFTSGNVNHLAVSFITV